MTSEMIISSGNNEESEFVRTRLIEYNATHVPDHLSSRYEEISLVIKNADGLVVGGILAVLLNQIESIPRKKTAPLLNLTPSVFKPQISTSRMATRK